MHTFRDWYAVIAWEGALLMLSASAQMSQVPYLVAVGTEDKCTRCPLRPRDEALEVNVT